jgi:PAS domain S-box-containing protein
VPRLRFRDDRHRDELRIRVSQQAAVADLGQKALRGLPLEELLEAAARAARAELDTDYASLAELTGDRQGLLVRAGAGLPDGVEGGVLPVRADELPGYVLESGEPVAVEDFGTETRAGPSPEQRDLGVVSAMAAPIGGRGRHYGVIAVHNRTARWFSPYDLHFLHALANVVSLAVERARNEELVRDSEARFRELADTTPAMMWMTDSEGHVTFVNRGWLRYTGRTFEEELGDSFGTSAHPDDRPELLARWREAFQRREEFRFEYRLQGSLGGYRWVLEVGTPRFSDGEFVGYVGTCTDIHERRAMEDSLRESEASFRELADTAPVMIWTTDTDGLVTFVNAGWLRFTGTSVEEELGSSWELGVHPDDVDAMLASWRAALAERSRWEYEYRLRSAGGDHRWVVDRGVPRYVGGRFAGYVGTAIDIHERKLLEQRLREIYHQEHTIAETLQRSLLPERLPEIEGLGLAARYLPAGAGSAIGGDWYDVLERPDGRVALVVGDVVGHGLRAASTMGQLRNAFRAYGLVEASPAEVVARINRLVMSGVEEVMATVLYIVLDRETGEVAFSAAGHPPPLLLAADGTRFLEGGRSVPIGATDPAVFREARAVMPPGSTLLLYTDGLIERRDVPLSDSLDQLAEGAGEADQDLEALCERVLRAALGNREPVDDVALLAVRPARAPAEAIRLTLPAEPESLSLLRRRLARFLHAAGATELETYEVTLTVCEAAGNAIEHAYGPGDASFDVEVRLADGELTAGVRDHGHWRERRGEHRGRGLKIIEGLMDEVHITKQDGGTLITMRRRLAGLRAA